MYNNDDDIVTEDEAELLVGETILHVVHGVLDIQVRLALIYRLWKGSASNELVMDEEDWRIKLVAAIEKFCEEEENVAMPISYHVQIGNSETKREEKIWGLVSKLVFFVIENLSKNILDPRCSPAEL